MNIKELKLFQSIKCGSKEVAFAKNDNFDMSLDLVTGIISITSKKEGVTTYTSLSNAPWFTEVKEKKVEQKESTKDPSRVGKKTAKTTPVARPKVSKAK